MTEAIVKCVNLGHVYGGQVVALRDVNLEINRGELVGVIGQNGSGKTTLVKHFNGLLKPTTGNVYINGKDTRGQKMQKLAAEVGYVFQNPNHQLFAKTIEDELEFGPKNLGLSKEEIEERKERALEFFDLGKFREHHPYRIGFPLRKLVGMASIYTMRPDVFILDEPTTGQDNVTTQIVYRLIRKLRDEGSTVICVAHDMILLAEVVERLIVMRNSLVIADSTPDKIFADRALMSSTHLLPPQITDLSLRLVERGIFSNVSLSVPEMVNAVTEKLPAQKQSQEGA